eukprot:3198127-Amphidinium_carterae.1
MHVPFLRRTAEECNLSSSTYRIFTDGSFKDHCAGWSWVCIVPEALPTEPLHTTFTPRCWGQVLRSEHPLAWGLNSITSYTAELVAIAEALAWLLHQPEISAIEVTSDCEAALVAISTSSEPSIESMLIERVRLLLKIVSKHCVVTFAHCGSHQGNFPNDCADELANRGRNHWASTFRLHSHVRDGKLVQKPRKTRSNVRAQQEQWEITVFGKCLLPEDASARLPMVTGRDAKAVTELQLGKTTARMHQSGNAFLDNLRHEANVIYDDWRKNSVVGAISRVHRTEIESSSQSWGDFSTVMTFNTNKIPWTYLPEYLDIVYQEASWTVLCLQEIHDDSGMATDIAGWWKMNMHSVLVTRCFNGSLLCLALHKNFAPTGHIPWKVTDTSVAATCFIGTLPVKFVGTYFPNSGYDRDRPEMFFHAINNLEVELDSEHVLLLGDFNAWLGNGFHDDEVVGPYNLVQTNARGVELASWLCHHRLLVSSTFFNHLQLCTRVGWDGSQSAIDYIIATPAVHKLFAHSDIMPIASKSDHFAVRLQAKTSFPKMAKKRTGKRVRVNWDSIEAKVSLNEFLPSDPPSSLQEWHDHISRAAENVASNTPTPHRKPLVDSTAHRIRELRNNSHGVLRRELSKTLYAHLKRSRTMRLVADITSRSTSLLFPRFRRVRAQRKVTILDTNGVVIDDRDVLCRMEEQLAGKINAVPVQCWPSRSGIGRIDAKTLPWPSPSSFRSITGKSIGLTGPSTRVVKALPDKWLQGLPVCMCNDAAIGSLADASYNVQKLIPLPKINKAKVAINQFRGIAVSGFTRSLYTFGILQLLKSWLPVAAPFSFAFTSNRSANALQLALSTCVTQMLNWEGSACVAKLDIAAAFDSVPWHLIATALNSHGFPIPLIDLVLQSQKAGFVLHYNGDWGDIEWKPTQGVRQGCKIGPILYRVVLDFILQDVAASWQWGPKPFHSERPALGVEIFGPDL